MNGQQATAASCIAQGDALLALGQCEAAIESYDQALSVAPGDAGVHYNRGNALFDLHRYEAAIESYGRAIACQPDHWAAHNNRGLALWCIHQHEAAIASYDRAIEINPENADAYAYRGAALRDLLQYETAIASFDAAIALNRGFAEAYNGRGSAASELKRYEAALADFERAIALRTNFAEAYLNRGNVFKALNRYEAALADFDRALAINPELAEAWHGRANVQNELRQFEAALAGYDRAIALRRNFAEAYLNRGNVFKALHQYDAALASYERAIASNPNGAEAHLYRAELFFELKQWPSALADYERALAIDAAYAEAYYGRGETQRILGQYGAAAASLARALALKPDMKGLLGASLHVRMHVCDWDGFEAHLAQLTARIERGEAASLPYPLSAQSGSAALQRRAAEIWAREEWGANDRVPPILRYGRHERIRVGYFSADFHQHPVSTLTAELYELHDRARFEVTAFSTGPDTQDPMRRRLQGAFDRFIDVRGRSDEEVAGLARSMELDIAVDLGGFTGEARLKVFALRAAPLQVSYLGYLGTTAAPFMDYVIADATIVPPELRCHYTERMVYLPSYQANDSKRPIAQRMFSREELGLPPSGVVYCCCNANYKITPRTFEGWMRILEKVPGAVLLLYAGSEQVPGNLRREAERRGVDPARLVFCAALPAPEYLARYRAADLFLDTLPYNGGTTVSDALWAGLPVLTCAGEAFASRVAGSVLRAMGLPELITQSQGEYEELAVALGRDPERLAVIKQRLAAQRLTTPLFDSRRFTLTLEAAYQRIYERYQAELPPEDLPAQEAH